MRLILDASFLNQAAFGAWRYVAGSLTSMVPHIQPGISPTVLAPVGLSIPRPYYDWYVTGAGKRARATFWYGTMARFSWADDHVHWFGNYALPGIAAARTTITLHDFMYAHYVASGYVAPRSAQFAEALTRRSLVRSDGFVVSDPQAADTVLSQRPDADVCIAPPGPGALVSVDPGPLPSLPERSRGKRLILAVGAEAPHKRIAVFEQLFSGLAAKDWFFIHVGSGTSFDSEISCSIHAMSDRSLAALLEFVDAVAVPSSYEGFGMPVLEAAIFGKPIFVGAHVPALSTVGDLSWAIRADLTRENLEDFLARAPSAAARTLDERRELAQTFWAGHGAAQWAFLRS